MTITSNGEKMKMFLSNTSIRKCWSQKHFITYQN